MTSHVAVKTGVLPVCVILSLRLESCLLEIWSEKPVRIHAEDVSEVHFLRMLECAGRDPDVADVEVFHFRRNLRIRAPCRCNEGCGENESIDFHNLVKVVILNDIVNPKAGRKGLCRSCLL